MAKKDDKTLPLFPTAVLGGGKALKLTPMRVVPPPAPPETAPYVPASRTSKAAAKSIEAHLGPLQEEVLAHIRAQGTDGATDDEIEVALHLAHQTASARRRELVLKERIVDSGKTRRTRSGRFATVWIAK